ncbi:hypothetical protein [Helicobacter bilis]|uniref:hypothetical protein n=1 Tax=Helicobacter bilis TaxID=37372 RepID=UPI002557FB2B|nr:hypothetical protein [Helicobacter bilis]
MQGLGCVILESRFYKVCILAPAHLDKILESKQDISCMTITRFQILKIISHCSKNVLKGVWVALTD